MEFCLTLLSILLYFRGTVLTDSQSCPNPQMKRFKKFCIWEETGIASHYAAEEKCKRRGGHLAMPKDAEMQQFIKDLVHGGRDNAYWIGIRQVEDKRWVYMDHTPVENFTYWAPNEPGGARDRDCVLIGSHHQTKWLTTQCHWGYRYICQIDDGCTVQELATLYNLQIKDVLFNTSNLYPVGSRVSVECNPGFSSINMPKYLHCEIGGKWTNSTKCIKVCQVPNLPTYILVFQPKLVYFPGEELSLSCKTGKNITGTINCDDIGNWIGTVPSCIDRVEVLPRQGHPKITCENPINPYFDIPTEIVPMGTSIDLPCGHNLQKWRGFWMKEQLILDHNETNISNVQIFSNGTLKIAKMMAETTGLYTCITFSSNDADIASYHSVRLLLPRNCNILFDPPPSIVILSPTKFILLRCNVQGGIITWFTNGKKIINSNNHILLANSALLVRQSSSSKNFTCRAEHPATNCRDQRTIEIPPTENPDENDLNRICGRARVAAIPENVSQGKLVGGHVAPNGSHPWMVMLIYIMDGKERFLCGGNLINDVWVATVAHCFVGIKTKNDLANLRIKLGKYDRIVSEPQEKVVSVNKIVGHPQFGGPYSFDNDIALVRLSENVKFSDSILPICLPSKGFLGSVEKSSSGIVSGWGQLLEGGLKPRFLHQVRLPLVEYNICEQSTQQIVTENMFCAGYEQAVADSCQGDSGGPFELYVDGVAFLAGIVSWGEGCAQPGSYGFYTKVENYLDFIDETIKFEENVIK